MTTGTSSSRTGLPLGAPRRLICLLALAYGLTIANLYYCQPLLAQIARSFPPGAAVGELTTLNQLGYALGLVLIVPLGDILRRRPLVCLLLCLDAVALLATAAAPSSGVLLAAGTVLGLATSSVVNILIPYAAAIAGAHERGRAVATMLFGGLLGILLSRTVAGLLGDLLGWRALFLAAAGVTLVLAAALARAMTPAPPSIALGYREQLLATLRLAAREPVLRQRSLIGACVFACFGAFWATAAFLLAGPPYAFGEAEIGLLALTGVAGALAARAAGRAADRGRQRPLTGVLLVLGLAACGALWAGGQHLAWLLLGVVAMDVAVSGVHVLNLSVVYGRAGTTGGRVATVYMTVYTLGGVLGSLAGSTAYRTVGWPAVPIVIAACMAAALAVWARRKQRCGSRCPGRAER